MRDFKAILLLLAICLFILVAVEYVSAVGDYITEPTPVPV